MLFATGCAALSLLSVACAGERPPAREPAPSPTPALPLPGGLDAAVRVDVAALSAELGQGQARQFLLDAARQDGSARTAALLGQALERAALIWFGLSAQSGTGDDLDVLVLRGHFAGLADGDSRWSRRDSGVELLDLDSADASGYVRMYRLPGAELVIWSSRDALPGVERALAGDAVEAALRPPERGAVSLAARPEAVLARAKSRYPELAERFRAMRRMQAFVEPTAGVWRADVSLDFENAALAGDASEVLGRLREALARRACAVGAMARALAVTRFEGDVRVQTVLLGAELEAVKACVLGDGCCA